MKKLITASLIVGSLPHPDELDEIFDRAEKVKLNVINGSTFVVRKTICGRTGEIFWLSYKQESQVTYTGATPQEAYINLAIAQL